MKKLALFGWGLALTLSLAACDGTPPGTTDSNADDSASGSRSAVGLANPFIECHTIEEAIAQAGFPFALPSTPDGYEQKSISVVKGELISVIFENAHGEQLCLRKGIGERDVSGDFNRYDETRTAVIDGITITLKGNGDTMNLATWSAAGFSYSASSSAGLSEGALLDLVRPMVEAS